jgi:hypothetical protein
MKRIKVVKCEPTTTCRARTGQPRAGTHQTSNPLEAEGRSQQLRDRSANFGLVDVESSYNFHSIPAVNLYFRPQGFTTCLLSPASSLLLSNYPANRSICPGDRPGLISSVGWLGRPFVRCSPFAGDSCSGADSSCCSCCRLSSSRRIRSRPRSIKSAADACKGLPTESLYWRSAISIWWLRMIWRKLLDSSFNLARRLRCASRSWTLRFLRFLGGSCAM